jgi:predicted nucleic acid-binding Zn ribbon protein
MTDEDMPIFAYFCKCCGEKHIRDIGAHIGKSPRCNYFEAETYVSQGV